MTELQRVLEQCRGQEMPFCQAACPLHVDMKGAIALIRDDKFDQALKLIKETLPFPGVMGRICTRPCEDVCQRKTVEESIAIASLKRSAYDYASVDATDLTVKAERKEKVAVVGGGPAGLIAAYDLRKLGYQVTIFEALPVLGGMLAVGIPRYRLPSDILDREISIIEKLGVTIRLNTRIGNEIKISDLRRDFAAVFIAIGTQLSRKIELAGAESSNVLWGVDFLRQVNLGQKVEIKDEVVVIGGGNVAIDAALTALRLGAKKVQLACLECRDEMPAFTREVQQALDEGVILNPSWGPRRILSNNGRLEGVELVRCTSVFDLKGKFAPSFDNAVTMVIPAAQVILSIGQAPDASFLKDSGIQYSEAGYIRSNSVTLETSLPGVFAGGDAVYGPKSVIEALAAGRKAAISIDRYLNGVDLTAGREGEGPQESRLKVNTEGVGKKKREVMPTLPLPDAKGNFKEVDLGFSKEQARQEAERCLSCECKVCVKDCEFLKLYCDAPKELAKRFEDGYSRENPVVPYSCNLCDLCEKLCPEELNIGKMCLEQRHNLVQEKLAPLSQHKPVISDQEWASSDSFSLTLPGSAISQCDYLFFPGCSLSAYSPDLVMKTYEYLRDKLPGTGIILGCCGIPSHDIGEEERFQHMLGKVTSEIERVGASGLIVACPDCYRTFKEYAPDIKLKSVYEVMVEHGLPEEARKGNQPFSIHDSCRARYETELQDSVRAVARELGYQIIEVEYSREKTRCCGMGGMAAYIDMKLMNKKMRARANEMPGDVLTYCVACRDAFAIAGKPAIHLLDLVFNPEWEKGKRRFPTLGETRRKNQSMLKTRLLQKIATVSLSGGNPGSSQMNNSDTNDKGLDG